MSSRLSALVEVAAGDTRYAFEAYEFLCQALPYTQRMLDKPIPAEDQPIQEEHNVSIQELLEGIRRYALEQFGMMAAVVFRAWGVQSTSDFGQMVFRLIDNKLWLRSASDNIGDFDNQFDFDEVFVRNYKIEWTED